MLTDIFVTTDSSWTRFDARDYTIKQLAALIAASAFRYESPTKRKAKVLAALNLMRVHNVETLVLDGIKISTHNEHEEPQ